MTELAKVLWFLTLIIFCSNDITIWWFVLCAIAGAIIGIYRPEWLDKI